MGKVKVPNRETSSSIFKMKKIEAYFGLIRMAHLGGSIF